MEGLEELGDLSNQSVDAVAKLAGSDQVPVGMHPHGTAGIQNNFIYGQSSELISLNS